MKHKKLSELEKYNQPDMVNEPEEIREEINSLWKNNRKMILQTAGVVAAVAVVATAFFLGRTRILKALKGDTLYSSGMEQLHKLADKAVELKDSVMDKAEQVTHAFAERAHVSGLN